MSANIDTMLYVGDTPWHGKGVDLTLDPPKSAQDIIRCAKLGWNVDYIKMTTELHGDVPNFHAIYRTDTQDILGVVNKARPRIVQNTDMFNAVDHMIGNQLDVETAASLGIGETVFGCFKIREQYRLLDDDVDHFFVIVNDHLKVDGKVTVLNTPVRVVCQNTLSEALSNSLYKLRIPISADSTVNASLATNLIESVDSAITALQTRAEYMVGQKIDKKYVDKLMDVLFPFHVVDGERLLNPANERIAMTRDTFISNCMGADNLGNYRGTQWQVFNALTDFTQHYHKSANKAYDINYRMQALPGIGQSAETSKVIQFLKIADKLAA